jgi:hypothetical protein
MPAYPFGDCSDNESYGGQPPMAKNKTEIHVTARFDGELDAADVFVSLIAQKHTRKTDKEYLTKTQEIKYNKCEIPSDRVPSGLCG